MLNLSFTHGTQNPAIRKKSFWILEMVIIVVIIIVNSVHCTGSQQTQFTGPLSTGEPLPEALIASLEQYVIQLMEQQDVPGVAMVLVQGDQVVYAKGLGVRDLETKAPVGTDTRMGIGSSTKPLTAVMVASLVDEGILDWDTPVTDILPAFALFNPDITRKVTMAHTLCMCTGVPRRIEEISAQYSELTAEDVIESLATIPLVGAFGHHYGYSSRMFSAGGYLAAMAAGGKYGNLAQAYTRIMQEQVFNPLGMTASTFSIDEALASGNYATPYYSSLSGYEAIPPEIEGIFTPIAPSGALWSTVDDLGKFLMMLLNDGVSADGQRVISPENLACLWEPRTTIDETFTYGLGWNIENYQGLKVIDHPGGTVGFASELVIIPDLDLGFAMLVNRLDLVYPIGRMTRYRLLEMLTGSEQVYDRQARKTARALKRQIPLLLLITRERVKPDKITPFLGTYHNPILGTVNLVLKNGNTLWIDFGEYESAIRPLILEENRYIFFESVFIGKTIQLTMNPDGVPTMSWPGDEDTYEFTATSFQE